VPIQESKQSMTLQEKNKRRVGKSQQTALPENNQYKEMDYSTKHGN